MTDNMYNWVTKRRNFIGGACSHACRYCYVQDLRERFPNLKERYSGPLRLLENELKKNEGSGNTIFVCTCNDMFAEAVPSEFIEKVLEHCRAYPENTYLFQTKNTERFRHFSCSSWPENSIFGTTMETNRDTSKFSKAMIPEKRGYFIWDFGTGKRVMISIEPVMDFDMKEFVNMIDAIHPEFVSIGADSKKHDLPEPSPTKVRALIRELRKFTQVRLKPNLERIIGKEAILK